jgi:hypothetical protein
MLLGPCYLSLPTTPLDVILIFPIVPLLRFQSRLSLLLPLRGYDHIENLLTILCREIHQSYPMIRRTAPLRHLSIFSMAVDELTVVGDTSWGEATVETGKTPLF